MLGQPGKPSGAWSTVPCAVSTFSHVLLVFVPPLPAPQHSHGHAALLAPSSLSPGSVILVLDI